jgi:hypothetical protein
MTDQQPTIWPTDNHLEIPSLDLSMAAVGFTPPLQFWGARGQQVPQPGTYSFYCYDERHSNVLANPSKVFPSGPTACFEINVSLYDDTERWVAIGLLGKRRACSRAWAEGGVRVHVDLNVPARFQDINLLGIPKGWHAWATRGYVGRLDALEAEINVALEHGGPGSVVCVLYDSDQVRQWCAEHYPRNTIALRNVLHEYHKNGRYRKVPAVRLVK